MCGLRSSPGEELVRAAEVRADGGMRRSLHTSTSHALVTAQSRRELCCVASIHEPQQREIEREREREREIVS